MIRNVVFDVGNVFVRWSPETIAHRTFGDPIDSDVNRRRAADIFGSPTWKALNRGELTFEEAAGLYRSDLGFTSQESDDLFFHIKDHQTPIDGTEELARGLKRAGYGVFGLTDNVHEMVAYQKSRYRYWDLFDGVIVSAEVGVLKPDPAIFRHLLERFALSAAETVFLDDVQRNVDGARAVGMEAFVFSDADQCAGTLRQLGLSF